MIRCPAPRLASVSLLLVAALLGACSGATEIRLQADRETISAGGVEAATITAEALLGGDPVKPGTTITFESTGGNFDSATGGTSVTKSAGQGGRAEVKLYSALTQGSATVTATFTDSATSQSATSSLTITFGPPAGSSTPVDGTFRLTCDAVNIGALREPVPNIQVTCQLSAQTRAGQAIKAAALSPTFLAEAGMLTIKDDATTGERVVLYSPKGGPSSPKDVPPEPTLNEPSYADKNGRQRNPRDGLVTLIAVVDGEEAFTDLNGNGKYDQGEPFVDAAEPFVDLNDNDQWDADEKYVDANGNGKWDAGNGKWDSTTKIMAVYKILWTGPLDNSTKTSRLDRAASKIVQGGKLEITAFVLDANLNPLAAFGKNSDALSWTLSSNGDALSNSALTVTLDNALGFSFDRAASNERKRWKILSNSFTPPSHKFTVEDGYPTDTDPPTSFNVSASVSVSPGPVADGYFVTAVTEALTDKVEGTCD